MFLTRLLSPTFRIVFGLVALTISIILMATFFGVFPDHRTKVTEARKQLCESLAIGFSTLASRVNVSTMEEHFQSIVDRNQDIESLGLRLADGSPVMEIGEHFSEWSWKSSEKSNETKISIPIYENTNQWGTLEVRFRQLTDSRFGWIAGRPEFVLAIFVAMVGMIVFYPYLRYVLRHLDPSRVIPGRVREALDTLAEGLVVMDNDERIVLANKAFLNATQAKLIDLIGRPVDTALSFISEEQTDPHAIRPWRKTLSDGLQVRGSILQLATDNSQTTYSVSCSPIHDEKGNRRGALVSLEDVTQLENKKNELKEMVVRLDASTAEIKRQNRELEILATRDALTGCINRRSFFQYFDQAFSEAIQMNQPLSVMMVDIDHFKSINDNHGHGVGDVVLAQVAKCLEGNSREQDFVCRYGGEEFSILLPATAIDEATLLAEDYRLALEKLEFEKLSITASIGVSALSQRPESPQDLLEQADVCLYVAKRNGRNQVIRHDDVPEDLECDESQISRTKESEPETRIPFHAVTALISALAYRDQLTACHSRRVADLCVAVGEGLLPMRECYLLEIAGLLHDIGKIGVPDAILLKPGPLTEDEWKVMDRQQRLGAELVRVSFGCRELDEILENYRTPFGQSESKLPIGSRILAIVDAYDSMVTDKVYRKGLTTKEAIAEIKRCSGEQFDPELVIRVVRTLQVRGQELTECHVETSKAAALSIGMQIERLYSALDERDIGGIRAIASHLEDSANQHGATQIAEKAQVISRASSDDLYDVLQTTNELLDLCRLTQRALLETPS